MRMKPVIYGIISVVIATTAIGCGRQSAAGLTTKPLSSCTALLNIASQGCDLYHSGRGAWPNSLDEVFTFRDDLPRKDAWGHDFGFTPFDGSKGYGEVISYGQDGKPGGTGEDSDIVIRFPVKENIDWDRQQAAGIKLPPQMQKNGQSDWYEFYLR